MRPGFRDQREEIKGILKYTEEHGLNSASEGEDEVMPMNLCRKLSPMLEWKLLTVSITTHYRKLLRGPPICTVWQHQFN